MKVSISGAEDMAVPVMSARWAIGSEPAGEGTRKERVSRAGWIFVEAS